MNPKEMTRDRFKGYYLIDHRHAPIGANRIDFEVRGRFMSINHEPFREAEESALAFLWQKATLNPVA
jgi:hypothetical protein